MFIATSTITVADFATLLQGMANTNIAYLGISVTILALLGGAFYLFNFKPLKDTIEKQEGILKELKKEIIDDLASGKRELKEEQESFQRTNSESTEKFVDEKIGKMFAEMKTELANLENAFSEKLEETATAKDEALQTVILSQVADQVRVLEKNTTKETTEVRIAIAAKSEELKTSISDVVGALKLLKRRVKELEVFKFSQKNQMGAIYGSIELLKEAVDEDSWQIQGSLERLAEEIKDITLEADVVTRIEEQLARLDDKPKYRILADKIRTMYPK